MPENPPNYNEAMAKWQELFSGSLEGLGLGEAKAMAAELLAKAVGEIEPFKDHYTMDIQRSLLGQQQGFLDTQRQMLDLYQQGVGELFAPDSDLAKSQAARLRTGARQQLSSLGQNAALAGVPASQSSMLDVMQGATDRLAAIPSQNLLAGMQAAGVGSELAGKGVGSAATGVGSAAQAFQTAITPASMISQLYGNTQVMTPLLGPGIGAIGSIGQGLGTFGTGSLFG